VPSEIVPSQPTPFARNEREQRACQSIAIAAHCSLIEENSRIAAIDVDRAIIARSVVASCEALHRVNLYAALTP
jgi:hypothetical protein